MIQLRPIGIVRNAITESNHETRWEDIESKIVIDAQWRDALGGIEQFSHVWIIFYLDRMPASDTLQIHPMRRDDLPLVGIFATRSPQRPNPIGVSAVELLAVRDNVLFVRGLDALDGTPVLDVKPYLTRGDAIPSARVGEWVLRFWNEKK